MCKKYLFRMMTLQFTIKLEQVSHQQHFVMKQNVK